MWERHDSYYGLDLRNLIIFEVENSQRFDVVEAYDVLMRFTFVVNGHLKNNLTDNGLKNLEKIFIRWILNRISKPLFYMGNIFGDTLDSIETNGAWIRIKLSGMEKSFITWALWHSTLNNYLMNSFQLAPGRNSFILNYTSIPIKLFKYAGK
jgi:hypothetical protein